MSVPVRLGGFAVALALVLALGFGVGRLVEPVGEPSAPVHTPDPGHSSTQDPSQNTATEHPTHSGDHRQDQEVP